MPNRLALETSPYLLQHKDNPVDWFPWGDEAFDLAKKRGMPILLSVGYSACHWCHVMESESFEDQEIAELMNELFISIKVDREERPDIDGIYMTAVQTMTGHGGWPMTVFLTPDGYPFFGGTYFPKEDRGGLPAFPTVLTVVSRLFNDTSEEIIKSIQLRTRPRHNSEEITEVLIAEAAHNFSSDFDPMNGGTGIQPKFPQPMGYELLLRNWKRFDDNESLRMVDLTLEKMAFGGIYDQIGGGFARYSTDTYWLVPHFEKMLYDNAQLVTLYLHAWQVTKKPLFRKIVKETIEYVLREMTHKQGGFFSSQDADSDGEEGKFYVWIPEQLDKILGEKLSSIVKDYWGITREGNFEGKNILHVSNEPRFISDKYGITESDLFEKIQSARDILYEARSARVKPFRDEKIITSWNSFMMGALAEAGAVLKVPEWVESARINAEFLIGNLYKDGRLLRTWKDDGSAGLTKHKGYLEDYAALIRSLIILYEATFEIEWIRKAENLASEMIELFWSNKEMVFYDTGIDHEELILRPRDVFDNATPSGGSLATQVLLHLSLFTANGFYGEIAKKSLSSVRDYLRDIPGGMTSWICAVDLFIRDGQEVVIIGSLEDPLTMKLFDTARSDYAPNRLLAGLDSKSHYLDVPLFKDKKPLNGMPTAFVCQKYVCEYPVTSSVDLLKQLS